MFVIASMISIPFTEMKRVYVFAIAVVWRRVGVNEPLERFKKRHLSLKFRVFFAILFEFFREIYTKLTILPRQAYTAYTGDGSNISATIITSTKGPLVLYSDALWHSIPTAGTFFLKLNLFCSFLRKPLLQNVYNQGKSLSSVGYPGTRVVLPLQDFQEPAF